MKCPKCGDECIPGDGNWCTYCKELYEKPCPSCAHYREELTRLLSVVCSEDAKSIEDVLGAEE